MRECFATTDGPDAMVETVRRMQSLYDRIETLPQVSIAEIGGAAHGGGSSSALACDLRIAADTAPLGLPDAARPAAGAGGTQRLSRLAGPGIARRMILAAEVVTGAERERSASCSGRFRPPNSPPSRRRRPSASPPCHPALSPPASVASG